MAEITPNSANIIADILQTPGSTTSEPKSSTPPEPVIVPVTEKEPLPAGPTPRPELLVDRKSPDFEWIYPEPYGKTVHSKHRQAVKDGTIDPWTVEHIPWGRGSGCQHHACKISRKEFRGTLPGDPANSDVEPQVAPADAPEALDAEFFELFDEDMIATIADTPNQIAASLLAGKGFTQKVLDVWEKTSDKEMQIYGKQGKKLLQMYLRLPDGKHKSLILFLIWFVIQEGLKVKRTLILIKAERDNGRKPA